MAKRLTAREIEAILAVAGDADEVETIASCFEPEERQAALDAYWTGADKLKRMLAGREAELDRRRRGGRLKLS